MGGRVEQVDGVRPIPMAEVLLYDLVDDIIVHHVQQVVRVVVARCRVVGKVCMCAERERTTHWSENHCKASEVLQPQEQAQPQGRNDSIPRLIPTWPPYHPLLAIPAAMKLAAVCSCSRISPGRPTAYSSRSSWHPLMLRP